MQIDIPAIDYKNVKVLAGSLPEVIILHEKQLEHKWKFKVCRNTDGIENELLYQGNEFILKSSVCGVSSFWNGDDEAFNVEVITAERRSSFMFVVATMNEAMEIRDKILNWLVG